MLHLFRRARRLLSGSAPTSAKSHYFQPGFESLEVRDTPAVSSIAANFTGAAIPAGGSIWFNSAAKFSGVPAAGATVHIANATITAPSLGTVSVPDAEITFNPNASAVSASFDADGWHITSPTRFGGNLFVDGLGVSLPNGLPGGIKNVVWSGDFTTDKPGLTMNWQWGAAAYTRLAADPAALDVKPTDALSLQYLNLDRAGTPENAKLRLTAGGTGIGLLNYTGTPTASKSVTPDQPAPPAPPAPQATASLSGSINFNRDIGRTAAAVQLYRANSDGSSTLVATTISDEATGFYSFGNLGAGTYRIVVEAPPAPDGCTYVQTRSEAGFTDGAQDAQATAENESIGGISLGTGQSGTEFNFTIYFVNEG